MVNQEYYTLGTAPSVIRQLFAYGLEQAKVVGPENVYDYSLGNPSIPAPKKVNESIKKIVDETDSIKLHGYSMAPGFEEARAAVAKDLAARFGLDVKASELFFTCGAAPALISIIKALIVDAQTPSIACLAEMRSTALPTNQVSVVSTKSPWISACANPKHRVVAVDCGIKHNIIRSLNARGCEVTIVPWTVTVEEVMAMHPDGLFISNGPGNPEDAKPVIALVRALRGKLPIFGICLGHQIIALAYGASTYKLKFGHRGGNHPVKNLQTGKVEITSQNHSYAVKADSLAGTGLTVTHVNLLDGTVEGQKCAADRVFSVQYHPESAPGPQDSAYLFDEFIAMMEGK